MINLNKETIKQASDIYDAFASELEFPEYFGRNIDALYDCLSEVSDEIIIVIDDEEYLSQVFPRFSALVNMLFDTASEKENIIIFKHFSR